jgi:hypothetical protein
VVQAFPGTILVPAEEEALKQAVAPYKGLSFWSDGSLLEKGQTGTGSTWLEASGTWKTKGVSLGQGKEVLDAELVGEYKALETAEQLEYKGHIRVLLDSQAAIDRLQDNRAGPG